MKISSEMPVANAICESGRRIFMNYDPDVFFLSQNSALPAVIKEDCKRVNFGHAPSVKNIANLTAKATQFTAQALMENIGPQILPFPYMWFEGLWHPDSDKVEGAESLAVSADSNGVTDAKGTKFTSTTYQLYALMLDGAICRSRIAVSALINEEDGTVYKLYAAQLTSSGMFDKPVTDQGLFSAHVNLVAPAMWAIGLMNCKNIGLAEIVPQPVRAKNQRRTRFPGVSYHTIVLPGSKRRGTKPEIDGEGSDHRALHQVRGHFKTFTQERPLLGQHVGTYWWGWQMRGNPENGVVVSDYELKQDRRSQATRHRGAGGNR